MNVFATGLVMASLWVAASARPAAAQRPVEGLPETIGAVRVNGLDAFDSDSIRHDGPRQWRWLSVPHSRLVMNPSRITDASEPMSRDLDFNIGYYAGDRPRRLLRLATMRVMERGAAEPKGEVWRTSVRPGDVWPDDSGVWSFSGVTTDVEQGAGVVTVTGEEAAWGHAAWRIRPPIEARSGAVRIEVAQAEAAWALKVGSPELEVDAPLQVDSRQSGVFIYDLADVPGWRGREWFDLKVFGVGPGSSVAIESIEVELRAEEGGAGTARELSTAWHPHQLTFGASYSPSGTRVTGADFFYDQNTVVRLMRFDAGAQADLVARFQGRPYGEHGRYDASSGVLLFESDEYAYALAVARRTTDGSYAPAGFDHRVVGWQWRLEAPLAPGGEEWVMAVGFATQAEGVEAARQRVVDALARGGFERRLEERKAEWDRLLASVPAPSRFGIDAVDWKGVTAEDHRRAYYAAWTFVIQNTLPPMPENGYPYPQTPTGKPSLWAEGASKARASAAWESFFGQQFLVWVDPETAWDAFTGIMSHVDETGWLDGECLPSRKAQTAWILYAHTGDRERLERVYPPISRYLRWREHNPRWIYKDHDHPNQKDTNFVDSLLLDLDYAIRIAGELGEDAGEWRAMKERVTARYVEWFFPEDREFPCQIYFAHTGERHAGHPSWVCSGLYLQGLPEEADAKLLGLFRSLYERNAELAGLDFCKYPIVSMIAYGLVERGLHEEAQGFVQSTLRDVIRVTRFAENYSRDPLRSWGVNDSLFGVGVTIDFTLMLNGMRIDRGRPEPVEASLGAGG